MAPTQVDAYDGSRAGGLQTNLRFHVTTFTGDAAYGAGGYTLTASDYHMSSILFVAVAGISANPGCLPVWNPITGKLQFFKGASSVTVTTGSGGLTEASTNDTYVNGQAVTLLVVGLP